jgi:hypothetical protein
MIGWAAGYVLFMRITRRADPYDVSATDFGLLFIALLGMVGLIPPAMTGLITNTENILKAVANRFQR